MTIQLVKIKRTNRQYNCQNKKNDNTIVKIKRMTDNTMVKIKRMTDNTIVKIKRMTIQLSK